MKGFRFRLDPILRLRSYELERRRAELVRADGFAHAARLQQRRLEADAKLGAARLESSAQAGADGALLSVTADSVASLFIQAANAERTTAELTAKAGKAREAMMEARQRVRSLEKLREHKLDEHRAEALRREIRELDEMGSLVRAWRNR